MPTFAQSCQGLTCSVSSQGTADPNTGDTIAYSWNWGDGTALSTGASPAAHVYAASGNYTITLTTTDGWGKSASTTRNVSLTEPAGNTAPTSTFTTSCASFTVCQMNSAGTADAEGDAIKYSWNWGDLTTPSTTASPAHTYAAPGTYTIVLTVTDVWGKIGHGHAGRDHHRAGEQQRADRGDRLGHLHDRQHHVHDERHGQQ